MLDLRDLRLVQVVAEHGTLVRAARVLGVSQPTLTRSLATLEEKLRGRLFERHRTGVIATNLGRAVLAEGADILTRMERLEQSLASVRGGQTYELRLAMGSYVGEAVGYRAAARMTSQHPTTRLRLIKGDWIEVPRALHGREAPLGLIDLRGHDADPGLIVEPLEPQPGLFVVHRDHPLTRRPSVTLSDIMAFPLFMIGRVPQAVQGPLIKAREAAHAQGQIHSAFPALIFESPSAALSQLQYCDAVLGVTPQIGGMALRCGEVVPLRWREPWWSLHPAVLRLRGRPLGEAEQSFLDLLRDTSREIAQEGKTWFQEFGLSADCA